MNRSASIHAYDVMSTVLVTAQLSVWEDGPEGTPTRRLSLMEQVESVGEPSDRRWLRDALIALAEAL